VDLAQAELQAQRALAALEKAQVRGLVSMHRGLASMHRGLAAGGASGTAGTISARQGAGKRFS
jgi:hypothetical protein